MAEINLAPINKIKQNYPKSKINLAVLFFSALIVAGTFLAYFLAYQKQKNKKEEYNKVASENNGIIREIEGLDPQGIKEFQKKAKIISNLLKDHIYFSKVLENIEKNTMFNVWYDKLTASIKDGSVKIEGNVSDLEGLAKQLSSFSRDKNIIEASMGDKVDEKDSDKGSSVKNFILNVIYKNDFIKGDLEN